MTSVFCSVPRPPLVFGPGLNVVDRRPINSNQGLVKPQHVSSEVGQCTFVGANKSQAAAKAAIMFRYPINTRLAPE